MPLPRGQPLIRSEEAAVRKTEERIAANFSHVGPHAGAGSGAGLNYCISRLKGRLERLETWRDGPDTDDSDEEEHRSRRPANRLMSY